METEENVNYKSEQLAVILTKSSTNLTLIN